MDVRRLIWDPWNIAHIARHDVRPQEVEEVCRAVHTIDIGYLGRFRVVGPTSALRMLSVILAPEDEQAGVYYVITARPASRKERKSYLRRTGGLDE